MLIIKHHLCYRLLFIKIIINWCDRDWFLKLRNGWGNRDVIVIVFPCAIDLCYPFVLTSYVMCFSLLGCSSVCLWPYLKCFVFLRAHFSCSYFIPLLHLSCSILLVRCVLLYLSWGALSILGHILSSALRWVKINP